MSVQNGLVRALEQQGFARGNKYKDTPQIRWERSENAVLERLCNEHGIDVTHPMRDSEEKRGHEDTKTYKKNQELRETGEQVMAQIEACNELTADKKELKKEIKNLTNQYNAKLAELNELRALVLSERKVKNIHEQKDIFGNTRKTQTLPLSDFRSLKKTAQNIEAVRKENAELKKHSEAVEQQAKEIKSLSLVRDAQSQRRLAEVAEREQAAKTREAALERGEVRNKDEYTKRLEEHAQKVKYKDGHTAFDDFLQKETERKQKAKSRDDYSYGRGGR